MESLLQRRHSLNRRLIIEKTENQQLKEQISRLQAMANVGMVSAMIAHEMNNILTPLGNYAQLALNHPEDKDLTLKAMQKTIANSDRATNILQGIVSMANGSEPGKKTHNLKTLVDETFEFIGRNLKKDRITITVNIDQDLTIYAEAVAIQQVLMNLILNAREAILSSQKKAGQLSISAKKTQDFVKIEITDTGCGIDQENLKQIFDPFYTTKTSKSPVKRTGVGLGLAFCRQVIEAHNGMISVESQKNSQTTFRIALPSS